MKATFDKQKLLAALTPAAGISQTKNTLVSVDGLLFECPPDPKFGDIDDSNPDLCRISAFDLEKGLRTTVECRVEEKGLFVINTVKILQIIRAMPDGNITIEIDDKCRVRITGGQSSFDITATPGEEFPSMPLFVGEQTYRIPQYLIKQMISRTVYAVAQNDQRAAFNGAFFRIRNGELTVVGCDGNRLAAAKCTLPDGAADAQMLIPGKFLGELMKMLRDTEDELTMILGRKHIIFKIDSIYFFTRMLDMEYIDYEKLLPDSYKTEVYVSADGLRSAVDRASIVTEDKLGGSGKSPIKLDIMDDAVTLSSVSAGGSVHERVPAAIGGADISIGFNCRYLLDALRAVPTDCETLRIRLNDAFKGIMVEPAGGTDFKAAHPDESVFGERKFDAAADYLNKSSGEAENKNSMFMSFIMPIRMNR
ncbi:MAG: DNA polymerase III subunit beta [Clostridia bacterium]|nr:DNA polymerase III subunit beta [Clostridia bacterium]